MYCRDMGRGNSREGEGGAARGAGRAGAWSDAPRPPMYSRDMSRGNSRECTVGTWRRALLSSPPALSPPCGAPATCPVSTEGWTRRAHFVREGEGGGDRGARAAPPVAARKCLQHVREGLRPAPAERRRARESESAHRWSHFWGGPGRRGEIKHSARARRWGIRAASRGAPPPPPPPMEL